MAAELELSSIPAGASLQWTRDLSDFPAPTWTLSYELVNAGARHTFTATNDNGRHVVNVTPATTATWAAGTYTLRGKVTDGAAVHEIARLTFQVLPSLSAATDTRTTARKALEALEAWFAGDTSPGVASYSIAGRQVQHWPPAELWRQYQLLKVDVEREKSAEAVARGLDSGRNILIRFKR